MKKDTKKRELLRMEQLDVLHGIIVLYEPAQFETVEVTVFGQTFKPMSLDLAGNLIFSKTQYEMYLNLEKKVQHNTRIKKPLELVVEYVPKSVYWNREKIDTKEAILESMKDSHKMVSLLMERAKFLKHNKDSTLTGFVVYGRYLLSKDGRVYIVQKNFRKHVIYNSPVEKYEDFMSYNIPGLVFDQECAIPTKRDICQCCMQSIKGEDFFLNAWICIDGLYYHENCYGKYKMDEQYAKVLSSVFGTYDFPMVELITLQNSKSYDVEFLAKTRNGDFSFDFIGSQIRVRWNKNYKKFDFDKATGTLEGCIVDKEKRTVMSENIDMIAKCIRNVYFQIK